MPLATSARLHIYSELCYDSVWTHAMIVYDGVYSCGLQGSWVPITLDSQWNNTNFTF